MQQGKVVLIGPAKVTFHSFDEQCEWYLDSYCPNWRNPSQPSGYLLPPMFSFKHAEVSDEAFENVLRGTANNAAVTLIRERRSDEAEYMLHSDITQAINRGNVLPLVSIHNLKIDDRRLQILKQLFPSYNWSQLQANLQKIFGDPKRSGKVEFDACLISAKAGFVFFEAKSSAFDGKGDFEPGSQHFPRDYKYGLNQLQAAACLLEMMEHCSHIPLPASTSSSSHSSWLRRVLLTPNLTRQRYEAWLSRLTPDSLKKVKSYILDTIQIFSEDCTSTSPRSAFCIIAPLLKEKLETGAPPLSLKQYEAYTKFLTGVASVARLPSSTEVEAVMLEEASYSQHLATVIEAFRISDQHPVEKQQPSSAALLKRASSHAATKPAHRLTPLVFLSPEQSSALTGDKHQLLIGPAGTGKTIILMSKALELLEGGQSVIVVAPNTFRLNYKMSFDERNFTRYRIFRWRDIHVEIDRMFYQRMEELYQTLISKAKSHSEYILHCISTFEEEPNFFEKMHAFFSDHHLFIDDAFVEVMHYENSVAVLGALFAFFRQSGADQYMWLAVDNYQHVGRNLVNPNDLSELELEENFIRSTLASTATEKLGFKKCELRRVMRCSEQVFRAVFTDFNGTEVAVVGHKLSGLLTRTLDVHCKTAEDALHQLQILLPKLLSSLIDPRIESINFAAVILSGGLEHHSLKLCESLQNVLEFSVVGADVNMCHWDTPEEHEGKPLFNLRCFTADLGKLSVKHTLACISYYDVPSFEWPLVIHATWIGDEKVDYEVRKRNMAHYIARSRAIVGLIEINFYSSQ